MLVHGLDKEGLLPALKSGEHTSDIFKYFKDNDQNISPTALKISKVLEKIDNSLVDTIRLFGSTKRKLQERVIRRVYSAEKMLKAGLPEWNDWAKTNLDTDRMIKEGTLKAGESVDDLLRDTYASVISGTYEQRLASNIDIDRAPLRGNKDKSRSRVLHFKDATGEVEFLEKFSEGGILGGVIANIDGTARDAATFRRLGTRPAEAWNTIKAKVGESSVKGEIDPATGKELPPTDKQLKNADKLRGKIKSLDNLFDYVTTGPQGGSSRAARYSNNIKSFVSMGKLGSAVVKAGFTDIGTSAANMRNATGMGFMESHVKAMSNTITALPKAKREAVTEHLQVYFNSALGDHHARIMNGDKLGGRMGQTQDLFFKLNGMTLQTDAQKTGTQTMFSHLLADSLNKGMDNVDPSYKITLERYGFTDHDFMELKKGVTDVEGTRMISQKQLDEATLTPPKGMTAEEYKLDVQMKVGSYLMDNTNIESPTPGAKQQNTFMNGVNRDSAAGIALNMVSQFKTFVLKMYDVVERQALSDPNTNATSLGEVLSHPVTNKGAVGRVASTALTLSAFGMLGMQLTELAKGRTIKPMDDPGTYVDAFVVGGAAGLYGDIIFGEYNKRYRNFAGDMIGPTGSAASDVAEVWAGLIRGEAKASGVFSKMINNIPFNNLILLRTGLDVLFLNQMKESMSPGYMKRRSAILAEEGQRYFTGE